MAQFIFRLNNTLSFPEGGFHARSACVCPSSDAGGVSLRFEQPVSSLLIGSDRAAACSYVVDPQAVFVGLGGGAGSFRVDTTPNDCRWIALSGGYVYATNASSYKPTQGDFTVTYTASANSSGKEGTISICGLSGANPCGVFTVKWRN